MGIHGICEIRLLPPLAIGRFGSSPQPMDNYDIVVDSLVGYRRLRPADTLVVDIEACKISGCFIPAAVRFRDDEDRIKPVCPFIEVWAALDDPEWLEPLTMKHLEDLQLIPENVVWRVTVANHKAFRRTGDPKDKIRADSGDFSDHEQHKLVGGCDNFLQDKSIPLGSVQYIQPTASFPEIRLRFTPAQGNVYGPQQPLAPQAVTARSNTYGTPQPGVAEKLEAVYDPTKPWNGYSQPSSPPDKNLVTNPGETYAVKQEKRDGQDVSVGAGYLDDACDGIVTVCLAAPDPANGQTRNLTAIARIVAGPPAFAPDSLPVRSVHDELLQALEGPDYTGEPTRDAVEDIVRRALETVRLMNTGVLNGPDTGLAVGDNGDLSRALEPIFDPDMVDALAIRARHERVLVALESGTLAWFARVLRDYDSVGDLTDEGRRKMPGMLRGADGGHLALTRRQISLIRAAAKRLSDRQQIEEQ